MRRIRLSAATVALGLALVGCAGSDDAADESSAGQVEAEDGGESAEESAADAGGDDDSAGEAGTGDATSVDQTSIQAADQGRHVIYNVDLHIETANLARSTQQAIALAESAGGFVSREDTYGDESATLTLRIPADDHASIVRQLEELGDVVERSRHAQDVTSEVVDVDARIESQRRSIARIRQLLDEAGDLDDVVSIESELARREADLDSLLSRQAELSSLTSLATITVTFSQEGELDEDEDAEAATFLSGLESGWKAFTTTVTLVSAGFGAVLPFLALAVVVGAPLLILRRRKNPEGAKLVE